MYGPPHHIMPIDCIDPPPTSPYDCWSPTDTMPFRVMKQAAPTNRHLTGSRLNPFSDHIHPPHEQARPGQGASRLTHPYPHRPRPTPIPTTPTPTPTHPHPYPHPPTPHPHPHTRPPPPHTHLSFPCLLPPQPEKPQALAQHIIDGQPRPVTWRVLLIQGATRPRRRCSHQPSTLLLLDTCPCPFPCLTHAAGLTTGQ